MNAHPTAIQYAERVRQARQDHARALAAIGNRAARRTPQGRALTAQADQQLRVALAIAQVMDEHFEIAPDAAACTTSSA